MNDNIIGSALAFVGSVIVGYFAYIRKSKSDNIKLALQLQELEIQIQDLQVRVKKLEEEQSKTNDLLILIAKIEKDIEYIKNKLSM